ncbi:MAG: phosphatase PAP2 family protein [Flavobacteriaceae bacterium]|nr:phosphatase PAP2 family protein [Flavobacteriaceae bacterium]
MDLLDKIILNDKELFIYLNALGNENWDTFWITVTNQLSWIPLFLLFFILIFKIYGWKKGLVLIIFIALLVAFSDQFVNFIKNSFERLRPCNDPTINELIRIVKRSGGYSFVSGHATTSAAVSLFMYLTLKKHYKYVVFFFIWPLFFAYSRIYLGVHFPIDIFCGILLGIIIGFVFYKLSLKLLLKIKPPLNYNL